MEISIKKKCNPITCVLALVMRVNAMTMTGVAAENMMERYGKHKVALLNFKNKTNSLGGLKMKKFISVFLLLVILSTNLTSFAAVKAPAAQNDPTLWASTFNLNVGETKQIAIKNNANTTSKYYVGNPSVASVSNTGVIKALKSGNTNVTVVVSKKINAKTTKNYTLRAAVNVKTNKLEYKLGNGGSIIYLEKGVNFIPVELSYRFDKNGSTIGFSKDLKFDKKYFTENKDGSLKSINYGETIIEYYDYNLGPDDENPEKTVFWETEKQIKVIISDLDVKLNDQKMKISKGTNQLLDIGQTLGLKTNFKSLDESIAKVENGCVIGLKEGTTEIEASLIDLSGNKKTSKIFVEVSKEMEFGSDFSEYLNQDYTNGIDSYKYLVKNSKMRTDAESLFYLNYGFAKIPTLTKKAMFDGVLKIIFSEDARLYHDRLKDMGYDASAGTYYNYEVLLANSKNGYRSLVHEVGHFNDDFFGGISQSKNIKEEYNKNKFKYGHYGSTSLVEFYAEKFEYEVLGKFSQVYTEINK